MVGGVCTCLSVSIIRRWDQSLSVPDMKRGSAGPFSSVPHLRDEAQGSKGPSVRVSLHFQPAGEGGVLSTKLS